MNVPNHFQLAFKEMGQTEIVGSNHNPRILEYHKATTLKASSDECSWCSSFVNWVLQNSRMKSTHSAAARSWLYWGVQTDDPKVGDVVVLWRDDPKSLSGHVGFFASKNDTTVEILGGNQSNKVCLQRFPLNRVLQYRRNG